MKGIAIIYSFTVKNGWKYRKSRSNEFSGNLLEERVKSFSFENFAR